MSDRNGPGAVGILVGGGPAPGINGVISAATIEARKQGLKVVGIYDGWKWLSRGDTDHVCELLIEDVSRIHFDGGSILRTSRTNPTKGKDGLANVIKALEGLSITHLITIGGDDTAYGASQVARYGAGKVRVAHVPKTIDNDLPLPDNRSTFGFQTARHVGVNQVKILMEDSRTAGRWFITVAMGRKAGHLALGIAKAAGATLSVIGEEFDKEVITLKEVCDVLEAAVLKRLAMGREDGVAIVAEGIAEMLDPNELKSIPGVEVSYDDYGHIQLADVDLGKVLKRELERRFKERGQDRRFIDINIGYELRCASPIPFDAEYVRDLGHSAMRYLLSDNPEWQHPHGALMFVDGGNLEPLALDDLLDPKTGRMATRQVDTSTESYNVARQYMIRLAKEDFADPDLIERMAKAGNMSVEEFREKFRNTADR